MSQLRIGTEEARRYLAAVEAELEDLDPEERSELLTDVEEHLGEVAIEQQGALEDRLGDPVAYAAELRTSAGFPPRSTRSGRTLEWWRSRVTRFVADERVRSLRTFAAELQPGWWVFRGYLLVLALAFVTHSMTRLDFPFPRLAGNQLLGVIVAGLAAWASFALGRRSRRQRAARIGSVTLSVVVALVTIGAVDHARSATVVYADADPPPAGVRHWDGSEALDLCPYDANGKLLEDVLVFDQAGRPITEIPRVPGSPAPEVLNAYPRGVRVPSADGVLRDAPCPKLAKVKIATPDGPSWVEVVVGGQPTYRALLGQGESRTFFGEEMFLVIGNAGAVEVTANGMKIGKAGGMGEVYRGVFDASTERLPPSRVGYPE